LRTAIAATDVYYHKGTAIGGLVLFEEWSSEQPALELRAFFDDVAAYESGSFFKRELPGKPAF
jgi:deoxyribonuclease V